MQPHLKSHVFEARACSQELSRRRKVLIFERSTKFTFGKLNSSEIQGSSILARARKNIYTRARVTHRRAVDL